MAFRLQAKYLFLTYPNCDADPNELLLHLLDLRPGTAQHITVAREHHQNGIPHLHAGIKYRSRIDVRSPAHFDFTGFHPNVQACRNWNKVLNYINKDGDTFTYDELLGNDDDTHDNPGDSNAVDFVAACTEYTDYAEWLNWCHHQHLAHGYARDIWTAVHADTSSTILDDGDYWQHVGEQLRAIEYDVNDVRSIVLSGPTGIGKTSWCLHHAPKPALLVTHGDGLKAFRADYHKSIIFDDMSFAHQPIQSQIHVADRIHTRQIHCRHRIATIPAGIHKFFTINPPDIVFMHRPPIERRINEIVLE